MRTSAPSEPRPSPQSHGLSLERGLGRCPQQPWGQWAVVGRPLGGLSPWRVGERHEASSLRVLCRSRSWAGAGTPGGTGCTRRSPRTPWARCGGWGGKDSGQRLPGDRQQDAGGCSCEPVCLQSQVTRTTSLSNAQPFQVKATQPGSRVTLSYNNQTLTEPSAVFHQSQP